MNRDHFWLSDRQFTRIEPHLPPDTRGKPRVDDPQMDQRHSHVLKSGAGQRAERLWASQNRYNRYVGWAAKGVWVNLFQALVRAGGPRRSSSSTARRSGLASGGKEGAHQAIGRSRRTGDKEFMP